MNFRDCFRTVWTEFSGLLSNCPDRIFRTIFGKSRTDFQTVCIVFSLRVIVKIE